jgi:hypothetical protein
MPAFGIVSHTVETFSGKSIFGQNGPKNNNRVNCFLKQTVCEDVFIRKMQGTWVVSRYRSAAHVNIVVIQNKNPQATTAPAIVSLKSVLCV